MIRFLRLVLPLLSFAGCTPETSDTSTETGPPGPGYVMVEISSIDDADGFGAYSVAAGPTLVAHEFVPVAAAPVVERLAGDSPEAWTVLIQFSDLDAAQDWYNDPEYVAARPLRLDATGTTHFALAEGLAASADVEHTGLNSYLLLHVDEVTDADAFDDYRDRLAAGLQGHGAVQLLDTANTQVMEGNASYGWTVLAGFPSASSLEQWRDSSDTAEDNQLRASSSFGASAVVVPGFDPSMFE